jgi:hypothetical protein
MHHFRRDCQEECEGLGRDHKKYWESLTVHKHSKSFLQGPSARRTKKVLKLNINQLWWVTGLLATHCRLKGHIFKMGLTNNPTCERCLEKDDSATHVLCDYEAMAYLWFRHLAHYFIEPGDYLSWGAQWRGIHNKSRWSRCKDRSWSTPLFIYLFIYSFIHTLTKSDIFGFKLVMTVSPKLVKGREYGWL